MNYFRLFITLGLLLLSNLSVADTISEMCKKLDDLSITGLARQGLELRCNPQKSMAKTAYIKDGKGYVVSNGKIIETVEGVGPDWEVSYQDGQYRFHPPMTAPDANSPNAAR